MRGRKGWKGRKAWTLDGQEEQEGPDVGSQEGWTLDGQEGLDVG
jgi:hypothetical protein